MKKTSILLVTIFIMVQGISAQDNRIEKGLQLFTEAMKTSVDADWEKVERLLHESIAYLKGSDKEELPEAMIQLAKVKTQKGEQDSTMFYLSQAASLSRQLNMPDVELTVITTKYLLAHKAERWPECQRLSLSIDSLANYCTKATTRVNAIKFKAKMAMDGNRMVLAEKLLFQALKLTDDIEDRAIAEITQFGIYNDLYLLEYDLKRYEKALDYCKIGNNILRKYLNPNAERNVYYYLKHVQIYKSMGQKENCLQYVDSVMSLIPNIKNDDARQTALLGSVLAFERFEEHERIISLLQQTDPNTGETQFPANLSFDNLIKSIKSLRQLGRKEEAKKLLARLKEQIDTIHAQSSNQNATRLYFTAVCELQMGDTEVACQHASQAFEMFISNIKKQLRMLSSDRRKAYYKDLSRYLFDSTTFAFEAGHTNDEFSKTAYEALLMSKGMLLASEKSVAEVIGDEGTAADKQLYEKLVSTNAKLNALLASKSPDMQEVDSIYKEITKADNLLAAQCSAYGSIDNFTNTTFDDVKKALGPNDVLIDLTYNKMKTGDHHYSAYIITHDSQYPLLLPVCTSEAIDSVEAEANHIPNLLYQGQHAEKLSRTTMGALLPYLSEQGTIYFVPSGAYHQLSIEALPAPDGQLLGDRYRFVRLSSARELCKPATTPSGTLSAVLYGGMNYDMGAEEMAMESARHNLSTMLATRNGDLDHGSFSPLPFTREEVHAIAQTLDGKASVVVYEGNEGSEESFLALSKHSPSIIHLATHGFFYTPDDAQSVAALSGYEEAMDLTGLVMSGGNAGVTGQELPVGTLCGLLTATDIANLDLRGTRLTCLSACHTGKGESTPEGIYGLQRALKKAGVQSILMCLWEASDQSTALFMKEFYNAYASNGWNTGEAFRHARAAVRKEYSSPYYWAGFILLD